MTDCTECSILAIAVFGLIAVALLVIDARYFGEDEDNDGIL